MIRDVLRGHAAMQLVFPPSMPEVAPSLPLLKAESAKMGAVFGLPVVFVDEDPGFGPRWIIRIGHGREDARLQWDARDHLLSFCRERLR